MGDRYLKAILTVIALELLWLGVKDIGTPIAAQANAAQANAAPLAVIIRGIEMRGRLPNAIPIYDPEPITITTTRPLPIEAPRPIPIQGSVPLRIEADRPIPVINVGYTPGAKPGE